LVESGAAAVVSRPSSEGGYAVSDEPLLDVSVRKSGTRATIAVAGEFDMSSSPLFRAAVGQALENAVEVVIIDAGGLTFADSSAVLALLKAREAAEAHSVEFQVTPISEELERILELTGLGQMFDIQDE
jgi:anti-sigma B factor antagonist